MATSVLASFHARPLSWLNWNLEILDFCVEGGKPENAEINPRSKVRTNNKLAHVWDRAGIELVGGERSHHYVMGEKNDPLFFPLHW